MEFHVELLIQNDTKSITRKGADKSDTTVECPKRQNTQIMAKGAGRPGRTTNYVYRYGTTNRPRDESVKYQEQTHGRACKPWKIDLRPCL